MSTAETSPTVKVISAASLQDVAKAAEEKANVETLADKVEDPKVTQKAEATIIQPAKKEETVSSDIDVASIKGIIAQYLKVNNGFLTESTSGEAIRLFQDIMKFALRVKKNAVYDEVFKFFKDNTSVILSPLLALQGVQKENDVMRRRIETFYTVFTKLTEVKPNIDIEFVRKTFNDDKFIQYITTKMKR